MTSTNTYTVQLYFNYAGTGATPLSNVLYFVNPDSSSTHEICLSWTGQYASGGSGQNVLYWVVTNTGTGSTVTGGSITNFLWIQQLPYL